jgi:hypothetical protein
MARKTGHGQSSAHLFACRKPGGGLNSGQSSMDTGQPGSTSRFAPARIAPTGLDRGQGEICSEACVVSTHDICYAASADIGCKFASFLLYP